MAEPRERSLLQFAIGASLAVLPVLLGILVLLPLLRPGEPATARGDRYASVRQLAALKTFEEAVVRRAAADLGAATPEALLQGVPACREAWSAPRGLLQRLAGRPPAAAPAERIAAQLAALDRDLERFGARANRRVSEDLGLHAGRWMAAANRALTTPLAAPGYPQSQFHVQCADLAAALAAMTRADGRMLDALAWRGTEPAAVIATWRPQQLVAVEERHVARTNPWGGLPGCIYLGRSNLAGEAAAPAYYLASSRGPEERLCGQPAMAGTAATARPPQPLRGEPGPDLSPDDARWSLPPSLDALLQPLETLRRPSGTLYRAYTEDRPADDTPTGYRYGPNRIALDGAPMDVGFSIDLTIDPALQALAQKTAACYTGRHAACEALAMRRHEDAGRPLGHRLLEGAMVRMAAIAVIDVASGRIEALAGALSPCARHAVDGPGRAADCDARLPYPVQYRPDALLNPAVFHDAMPASTIKPILASAFLADPQTGARLLAAERAAARPNTDPARDSLRGQLMRSDSARFLDRLFCADSGFAECRRPWQAQAAARDFGWNAGCERARPDCGRHDLLFGRAIDASAEGGQVRPLALPVIYGRLLTEPLGGRLGAPLQLTPFVALDAAALRACAGGADGRRPSDDDWEKCSGAPVVDMAAEGWGQGQARSSALGVAGMMAALAAAANGQSEQRQPHLVRSLRGVARPQGAALDSAVLRWSLAGAQPNRVSREAAELILGGLAYSHRAGTARPACEQVFDARGCRAIDWIAGKTGTPSFPNDARSLDELARLCGRGAVRTRSAGSVACGPLRPYKWYVAAYRSDPRGGPWTKAIGVLTERNWLVGSGRIHGAGDDGPNPAAEIALHIAGRQLGLLPGAAP